MRRLFLLLLAGGLGLAGCHRTPAPGAIVSPQSLDQGPASRIPLGNPPGQPTTLASTIQNPFEGDAASVQQGKALFSVMNCVYCHGSGAPGLMGPALNTRGWRYGGAPGQLYDSIHDGRPQGMPAFGQSLPPQEIWKLVSYIESLGGADAPARPGDIRLVAPAPSATGPQTADQGQADAAEQARLRDNAEPPH